MSLSAEAIRTIADLIDAEADEADREALRLALARSLKPRYPLPQK